MQYMARTPFYYVKEAASEGKPPSEGEEFRQYLYGNVAELETEVWVSCLLTPSRRFENSMKCKYAKSLSVFISAVLFSYIPESYWEILIIVNLVFLLPTVVFIDAPRTVSAISFESVILIFKLYLESLVSNAFNRT
jgi:hypothetical protein